MKLIKFFILLAIFSLVSAHISLAKDAERKVLMVLIEEKNSSDGFVVKAFYADDRSKLYTKDVHGQSDKGEFEIQLVSKKKKILKSILVNLDPYAEGLSSERDKKTNTVDVGINTMKKKYSDSLFIFGPQYKPHEVLFLRKHKVLARTKPIDNVR